MKIIADLHLHSKYSRATSKQMDLSHMTEFAKYKGIDVLGTGDFTHPQWLTELKNNLDEDGSGLLTYGKEKVKLILSSEISSIYKQGGQTRRIHTLLLVPDLTTAEKIHNRLAQLGANLHSDGRPIIGLSARDLTEIALEANPKSMIIPAHAWTPWFSVFGSKSGFDSLKECFLDLTNEIFAIETGLSSDPEMNWRLSALDNITLISNSDAHSPGNLGREANVFEIEGDITFDKIAEIIKTKDPKKFLHTIEFFPEEGMYHFDGHRNCKFSADPFLKTYKDDLCPICHKPLTIGVANRVAKLADRDIGKRKQNFPDFHKIVPLREIIAGSFGVGKLSKKVQSQYFDIIHHVGSEFQVLLEMLEDELNNKLDPRIAEGIIKVRKGNITIDPGYDGVYGKVKIFNEDGIGSQKALF